MSALTGRFDFAFFVNLELEGKKSVLEWCKSMKLISNEYKCPECKSQMIIEEKADDIDGYVWVCRQEGENEHFVERSVRQGSFFQQTVNNISFIKIFLMVYLWIKKATPEFIEDELNLPKETVDELLNFFREICVEICLSKNTKIGGENVVAEINQCKFQKKKFKRSDYVASNWAFVGFEKETDKGFIEVVKENNEEELLNVIEKYILPGTILISDCWKLYDCLENEEFINLKESHRIQYECIGSAAGNSVMGIRKRVKRTFDDVPRISCNFDLYTAEYMWRRKHSDIPYDLMRSFFHEIIILFPPHNEDSEELMHNQSTWL